MDINPKRRVSAERLREIARSLGLRKVFLTSGDIEAGLMARELLAARERIAELEQDAAHQSDGLREMSGVVDHVRGLHHAVRARLGLAERLIAVARTHTERDLAENPTCPLGQAFYEWDYS